MSFVNVGSKQGDTFCVSIFHTGQNTCDVSLQNPLFSGDSSDWAMGVEALMVPLDGTRFLDKNHPVLFRLRRIQHGKTLDLENIMFMNDEIPTEFDGVDEAMQEWTEEATRLDHTASPCRELGDLIDQFVGWTSRINDLINRVGLNRDDAVDPDTGDDIPQDIFNGVWDAHAMGGLAQERKEFQHFKARVSPSGLLSMSGSNLFWSNFFIETSSYARALTGLPEILAFDVDSEEFIRTIPTDLLGAVDYDYRFQDPTNARAFDPYDFAGTRSLWGAIDTRLSISVATDLPTRKSLTITDDRQCRDFSVGSFDLCNELKIQTEVTDQLTSVFTIESESRSGHVALKKSGPPNYWTLMAPSTNLRHLRIRLMMRERVWNAVSDEWRIVNRDLPVAPHQTWHCNLLFARRTH